MRGQSILDWQARREDGGAEAGERETFLISLFVQFLGGALVVLLCSETHAHRDPNLQTNYWKLLPRNSQKHLCKVNSTLGIGVSQKAQKSMWYPYIHIPAQEPMDDVLADSWSFVKEALTYTSCRDEFERGSCACNGCFFRSERLSMGFGDRYSCLIRRLHCKRSRGSVVYIRLNIILQVW